MNYEMYTTKQAAIYLGVTEADLRLAVREGKLRAWNMPSNRGLLVRKADLMRFREPGGRSSLARQLPLFAADNNRGTEQAQSDSAAA